MSYNVLTTQRFEKELKRMVKKFPSLKSEFSRFVSVILDWYFHWKQLL
jgi:mRNA-degrading endonuclease RelE of RelBE toxin-antitoxin system